VRREEQSTGASGVTIAAAIAKRIAMCWRSGIVVKNVTVAARI
jgi:hypothetical protein